MATNQITTSIVISFTNPAAIVGAGAGSHLSAEIDSRPDGYNKGVTNFIFGDSPAYLVYNSSNVVYTQRTTRGGISGIGATTVDVEDIITFAEVREGSLSKPPAGAVTWELLGGEPSVFTVSGTSVIAPQPIFSVYRATYQAQPQAFRLSGVGQQGSEPTMAVLILIKGTINP